MPSTLKKEFIGENYIIRRVNVDEEGSEINPFENEECKKELSEEKDSKDFKLLDMNHGLNNLNEESVNIKPKLVTTLKGGSEAAVTS